MENEDKKRTIISDRKMKIYGEVHSIFNENFDQINVTKDLQRLCHKLKFQQQQGDIMVEQFMTTDKDLPTMKILHLLFNYLPSFLTYRPEENSESEVTIWLKNIGFEEYIKNFEENDLKDLRPLIFVGLESEDFEMLGIKSLGHRKQISSCLKQLKNCIGPKEAESFFPITLDELNQAVSLDDPSSLQTFLINRFGEQSPCLKILKLFHQAFVVSFLGHLGETFYYNDGLRFKDVKGSWNVIFTYHDGSNRKKKVPYVSVTHKRKEMMLTVTSGNKMLTDLFVFEWKIQVEFDSLEVKKVNSVVCELLGIEWTLITKDFKQEVKDNYEKKLREAFPRFEITHDEFKQYQKSTMNTPTKKASILSPSGGLFSSNHDSVDDTFKM
eukprot:gene12507-6255_t